MEQAQKALQALSEEYQNLQAGMRPGHYIENHLKKKAKTEGTELETIILARQKLESQQQENQAVQQVSPSFQTAFPKNRANVRRNSHP
jgi:prefoldin beta subunit